ncbi:MAG: N-acetyl-gamma-glutamyl-phosphate reductase [Candidatus Hadarchaeales archaeon]
MKIKIAIVGASGYAAGELFRLLANHPSVEIIGAHDIRNIGTPVSKINPNLRGRVDIEITEPDYDSMARDADVVFSATPHKVAMKFVPKLLQGETKVIDLSADYRFEDVSVYEKYYTKHESPEIKGVYGLPEIYREKIRKARLIGNPGCFPTAAILGLAPLVKEKIIDLEHIIIDAKTGTSGAGAAPTESTHHPLIGANIKAYSATTHRHEPEISQELSKLAGTPVRAHFTPHLIPVVRGILSTMHVFLTSDITREEILNLYRKFYDGEPFVRIVDGLPEINYVVGSNYCDIGVEKAGEGERLVVVSAIDNLIKGAAGQAIQNMNIMFDLDEKAGLETLPPRP